MKIYKTIFGLAVNVDEHVNDAIKDGWEPIGGVSISDVLEGPTLLAQAMIKSVPE